MKTFSNWWSFKLSDKNEEVITMTYSLHPLVKVMSILAMFIPVILLPLGLIDGSVSAIAYLIISPLLIILLFNWKQIDVLKVENRKFIANSNQMNLDISEVSHLFVSSEVNGQADTSNTLVICVLNTGQSIKLFKVLDVGVGRALKDFGKKAGLDLRYEEKTVYHGHANHSN